MTLSLRLRDFVRRVDLFVQFRQVVPLQCLPVARDNADTAHSLHIAWLDDVRYSAVMPRVVFGPTWYISTTITFSGAPRLTLCWGSTRLAMP